MSLSEEHIKLYVTQGDHVPGFACSIVFVFFSWVADVRSDYFSKGMVHYA